VTDRIIDAFLYPRKIVPGCDHNRLWCKCDTPYWLRVSTESELARELKLWPAEKSDGSATQHSAAGDIPGSAVSDLQGAGASVDANDP